MASQTSVQDVIHSMEHGILGSLLRWALILAAVSAIALVYLFRDFRGLGTADGMDQAQVAREIARGNGFSTKFIRPLALYQLGEESSRDESFPLPEMYHGPVQPFINSLPMGFFKAAWAQAPEEGSFVFAQDRVIAGTSIFFLILTLILSFVAAALLFDKLVAGVAGVMAASTHLLWEFTLTGLPQIHMMFFFTAAMFCLFMAIRGSLASGGAAIWLAVAGLFFGVLTLTHGVGAFLFLGALIFVGIYFRPRGIVMLWMLGFFLVVVIPWCLRNVAVTGSPLGLAQYALVEGAGGTSEAAQMRSLSGPELDNVGPRELFSKVRGGAAAQAGAVFSLLGGCLVAPLFFVSLLHPFKRPETSAFRWLLLLIWLGSVIGMGFLGVSINEPLHRNNFHILFVPLFAAYGVAFLLILWNRTNIEAKLLKYALLIVVGVVSAGPFLLNLLPTQKPKVHWPPYLPSITGLIGGESGWMRPGELICSDQPWSVAWYADRECLWLPDTLKEFYEINDMRRAGDRAISGMLLSPITSDVPFVSGLVRNSSKDWLPLAMRSQLPQGFPLKQALPLPVTDRFFPDFLFLSDTRRWEEGTAEQISPAAQQEREKALTEGIPPTDGGPESEPESADPAAAN